MAYADCIKAITAAAGRELTPEELKSVGKRTGSLLRKIKEIERRGGDVEAELPSVLAKEADELKQIRMIEKRNRVLNLQAVQRNMDMMRDVWGDDFAGGLRAMTQGSLADRRGAKDSAAAASATRRHAAVSAFVFDLEDADLIDVFRSREFDLDIRKAIFAIDTKADTSGFRKEVVDIANIVRKHQEQSRLSQNDAGAWIGRLEGFTTTQTHDQYKIAKAGGMRMGDEANFNSWHDFIIPLIDWDKSFLDVEVGGRKKLLRSLWGQFSSGRHMSFSPTKGGKGFGSIGRRNSQDRVISFRDADAEQAYSQRFGIGDSLYDSVIHDLDFSGRDIGLMQKLGPNAAENVDKIFKSLERELSDKGELDKLAKLRKENATFTDKLWPVISGEGNVTDNHALAAVSESILNLLRMSSLGTMTISAINDINNQASVMNFYGDRTNGGFFNRTTDLTKALIGALGKGTSRNEKSLAKEAGILLESTHLPVSNMHSGSVIPGTFAKATKIAYKYFGAQWMQNRIRINSMMATISRYADNIKSTFADLPIGMQVALKQFDLSPEDWDLMRSAKTNDLNGSPVLNSDAIRVLPLEKFKGATEKVMARNREAMANKYQNLIAEIADMTITAPNATVRAVATQGLKRGTFKGEALRHLMLFRTYSISYMTNHLGRELNGYHPDRVGLVAALKRMVQEPSSGPLAGMAGLVAGGVFWGHMANVITDLTRGKEPEAIPTDAESFRRVLMAAFTRSGALGLYGDLMTGQVTDMTSGEEYLFNLLGPSLGKGADITDTILEAVTGDFDKATQKAFKTFYSTIPGRNLFYTRWATDYLISYRISEMLNPGYLDRMERYLEEERGSQFFVPPSEVIGN